MIFRKSKASFFIRNRQQKSATQKIHTNGIRKDAVCMRQGIQFNFKFEFMQTNKTKRSITNPPKKDEQLEPRPLQLCFKPIHQDTITLNYKKLQQIPGSINASLIKHLHLSHNNLTSLKNIQQFPCLQSLNVSHNQLSNIEQLSLIQNKKKMKRLGLKRNCFDFGYEKIAVRILTGLQLLDSKELRESDKKAIQELSEEISVGIVSACAIAERLISFMQGIVDSISIKVEMSQKKTGVYAESERNKDGFLSLLYENIPEKIAIQFHSILALNQNNLQALSIRSQLSLQQKIINFLFESDMKCTCRPINVKKELFESFSNIFDRLLLHYSSRFDKTFESFLHKKAISRPTADSNKFKKDSSYSKLCLLYEFYMLAPNKSKFEDYPGKYIQIFNPLLLENRSVLLPRHHKYGVKHGQLKTVNEDLHLQRMKDITNMYKFEERKLKGQNPLEDNEIQEKVYFQPEYIYDQFTQRIPMFEYSNNYAEILSTILLEKISKIVNLHDRICSHRHSQRIGIVSQQNLEGEIKNLTTKSEDMRMDNLPTTKPSKASINNISIVDSQKNYKPNPERDKTAKKNDHEYEEEQPKEIDLKNQNHFENEQKSAVQSFTPQQIYQISLKYKIFSALTVNAKRRKTLVK